MAHQEAVTCPAGHAQPRQRPDRLGRCTRCGAALVMSHYDDAVPKRLQGSPRITEESIEAKPIEGMDEE